MLRISDGIVMDAPRSFLEYAQADPLAHAVRVEVAPDGVGYLFLKVAEILALRGDSAAFGGIPGRNKHAGFVACFDLEDDLVHG
jgi:hypothetical protein